MTQFEEKLSAFLDDELSAQDRHDIETALAADPSVQAEFAGLVQANTLAQAEFESIANEPVPFALAKAIEDAPEVEPANMPQPPRQVVGWFGVAAVVVALAFGGLGGYWSGLSRGQSVASAPNWLQDIAEYHAVYAGQNRHLVEVPATEQAHIQTWLTATVGAAVTVPDLTEHGLQFQGARLLVAAGKPVAQLMYLDADARVVALCQIGTSAPRDGFSAQTIAGFEMVSWGGSGANFVIVGDQGRTDMENIAQSAAMQI
ncbi:anti-sigma factor [Roseobacter sp.]|uniref:anti-sigma factor family protein n=1 Tax=Roseobacter sp. TaxID=1907202 RepID=UPI0032969A4B